MTCVTPDTAHVRHAWVVWSLSTEDHNGFDRWLAAHDRVVAAQAWDEGFNEGHYSGDEMRDCECKNNPYRTEESN